ncbi:hypothetical protein GCM10027517_07940 [Phycicoccus ginsengisoli]
MGWSPARSATQRRALAMVLLGTVVATATAALPAAPAWAQDAVVTIVGPGAGSTVRGDVPVHVHLVAPDAETLTRLDVQIGSAHTSVSLDAGTTPSCAVECDLTVVVPPGGWSPPDDAGAPTYDPDGSVLLTASVTASSSLTWSDTRALTLDNDRPAVTVLDLPPVSGAVDDVMGLSAGQALDLRADTATTGGPEVTSVQLTVPWAASAGRPGTVALARGADGHWTGRLDTSAYPEGYFTGWLVALDADGTASPAVRVPFVVDRGLRLAFLPPPLVHAGATELAVTAAAEGKPTTWPVSYQLRVDARTVAAASGSELWQHPMSWARVLPPVDLPNGPHRVGWVVLDNRGATSVVETDVTLNAGPTVTVSPSSAVRGQALDVTVGLAAVTGATVRSWQLEATAPSGRRVVLTSADCPQSCPQSRLVRVPTSFDQTGRWTLRVTATDSFGAVRDTSRALTVVAASATRLASSRSSLTYGSSVRLTATVSRDGAPLPGAFVSLQFRRSGSSAWSTRATGTTSSTGSVSWTTTPTGSGSWRAVTAARAGGWAGSSSSSAAVGVRARVRLVSAPSTVWHRSPTTWRWDADPAESGVRLIVQVRRPGGAWTTVARPVVSSSGAASARLTFATRGTWYVRAVRPGTTRVASGQWSATRWVR